jgi:NAD(P)-dependent dehydrogenase (short-subunit alcohol dehydrogenase family)
MRLTAHDVVLVTGGGSGLGEASARALATTGARVIVLDLPASRGAAVVADLGAAAQFLPADVRDEDEVRAAIGAATDLGTLRAVVCCAGVATAGRILSRRGVLPVADFRRVIEINLVGTFNALRFGAEAMAPNPLNEGDRGVVVMTASVAAFDGQIGQAAYAASKGGIVALTLTAARDLADKAIRVVSIAPGVMETPMMAGMADEVRRSLEAIVPHPARLGRPTEYAMLVEHILANPLLNGETIRLDAALRMPPR